MIDSSGHFSNPPFIHNGLITFFSDGPSISKRSNVYQKQKRKTAVSAQRHVHMRK